jgi:hypothetical protein
MNSSHTKILICLLLTIATLAAFWEVQDHGFVNFDDDFYIFENLHVIEGLTSKNIKWAFSTLYEGFWMPLTWLSHMLDCELYGLNPKGHHLNNLLLHIVNTLLLFLALRKMTKALWQSAFIAALFALHPLHVETVAWVTERKDVLSTFFWMITMWTYAHYTERPGFGRYIMVFIFFSFGLMAKPMLVTLPFALLLLDYWPLGRLRLKKSSIHDHFQASKSPHGGIKLFSPVSLVLEKIPLIILSGVLGSLTFFAERGVGALPSLDSFPLGVRIANALVSYMSYIIKMIWPLHLTVFYPHPGMPPWWQVVGALLLLGVISIFVIKRARQHPYLPVGWLWYLGTLVPVIGLIQVGGHSMADRYTYVPLIGLFIILSWGIPYLLKRFTYKKIICSTLAGLWLLFLFVNTHVQVLHWRNSITLFTHALNVTSDNYLAHNNLAYALAQKGDLEGAIRHISEALRIKPNYIEPHYNLGAVLARQGKLEEAIKEFLWVLERDPNSAGANYNLGLALTELARYEEAIPHFVKALEAKPDYAEARRNLQAVLQKLEQKGEPR